MFDKRCGSRFGAGMLVLLAAGAVQAQYLRSPEPGAIYKEYTVVMPGHDFRVTDPNAPYQGSPTNSPSTFLPNPTMTLNVDDLQGAVRAEALIEYWGGHTGTTGQRLRFNDNAWIDMPELATTPPGREECYNQQWNIVVDVPLAHLAQGANFLQGTAGRQTCYNFGWGQWGWYALTLRVYYGSSKPHPTGTIVSPAPGSTLGEDPTIAAAVSSPVGIDRVEFLAYYEGYDEDGDGRYLDYHHSYHRELYGGTLDIANHVGTVQDAPWEVVWDTTTVPDQPLGAIKLLARIRDSQGYWYVTDEVDGLSLVRPGVAVRLYKPTDVPERFWVRAGQTRLSRVVIGDDPPLSRATEAWLMVRTWNGIDGHAEDGQTHFTRVNTWIAPEYGANHFYQYDVVPVPANRLVSGDNEIRFFSASTHHGIEILWPGPALIVRYQGSFTSCGDGIVDEGEQCDDGNATVGDGCDPECRAEVCGDGRLQAGIGEECDDGNLLSGDGCDSVCRVELLPARIVQHPQDTQGAVGQRVEFRVDAEGTAPLAYRWERQGGSTWSAIPGAQSASYLTPPVENVDDGARFRCVVSNSAGSDTSTVASLHVVELARATAGLVALYQFDEETGTTVRDTSGFGAPLDLEISSLAAARWRSGGGLELIAPTRVASTVPATKIAQAVGASDELTLEAWITPANLTQTGPARIVTISGSPIVRNVTLGQGIYAGSAELYDVRLRASATDTNGTPSLSTAPGTLTTNLTHVVFTRDAAGQTHIYVDGVERAAGSAEGDLDNWDAGYRLALGEEFDSTTRPWLGIYDLLALYDRALSAAEVQANFSVGPVHCTASSGACGDACPDDPAKEDPGQCGCGIADTDLDGDGVADCLDDAPQDAERSGPPIVGEVSFDEAWTRVELPHVYQNPIVILGPPTFHGDNPGVVEVRPGAQSFEVRYREWSYLDGWHTEETVSYLVLEAGRHEMPDGSVWLADAFDLSGTASWRTVSFPSVFATVPSLWLSVQGTSGADPVTVRSMGLSSSGFRAALFEEQALMDGHPAERVGYLAVWQPAGSGSLAAGGILRPYSISQWMVDGEFRALADGKLRVQEEQSSDEEVDHNPETVEILRIDGLLFGQIQGVAGGDPCTLRWMPCDGSGDCVDECPGDPRKIEPGICGCGFEDGDSDGDEVADCLDSAPQDPERSGPLFSGEATFDEVWTRIELPHVYQNPIVIVGPPSLNGEHAGVVQVRVDERSFEIRFREWSYLDGGHRPEAASFLVVEAGRHAMPDGSVWMAGSFELSGTDRWTTVTYPAPFDATPAQWLTVQGVADEHPVVLRTRSLTDSSFRAALFEEQALMDGHPTERVGYLAVLQPAGSGLVSVDGRFVPYSVLHATLDDQFRPVFDRWLRLQEEQSADLEEEHVAERVDVLALGEQLFGQIQDVAGGDPCALRLRACGGALACEDSCPDDPLKLDPGQCGCAVADIDTDADGVADCVDTYPDDISRSGPIHVGSVSADENWVTVRLPHVYQRPVVIIGPPTFRGDNAGVARVREAVGRSFEVSFVEWRYLDGYHAVEEMSYLVVEAGRYEMPDGSVWEAGRFALDGTGVFAPIVFAEPLAGTPELWLQPQTANGSDPVVTRTSELTATGFDAALFEEEALMDGHKAETVGYLAILQEAGAGTVALSGQDLHYVLDRSEIGSDFTATTGGALRLHEEQSADDEIDHDAESVSLLRVGDHLLAYPVTFREPDACSLRSDGASGE